MLESLFAAILIIDYSLNFFLFYIIVNWISFSFKHLVRQNKLFKKVLLGSGELLFGFFSDILWTKGSLLIMIQMNQ